MPLTRVDHHPSASSDLGSRSSTNQRRASFDATPRTNSLHTARVPRPLPTSSFSFRCSLTFPASCAARSITFLFFSQHSRSLPPNLSRFLFFISAPFPLLFYLQFCLHFSCLSSPSSPLSPHPYLFITPLPAFTPVLLCYHSPMLPSHARSTRRPPIYNQVFTH